MITLQWDVTIETLAAPAQMAAPTATANSATAVTFTRAEPPDNGGSTLLGYDLRYRVNGGAWITLSEIDASVQITGLSGGDEVEGQNLAFNAVGDGAWSASETVTTPAAPSTGTGTDPVVLAVSVGTQAGATFPVVVTGARFAADATRSWSLIPAAGGEAAASGTFSTNTATLDFDVADGSYVLRVAVAGDSADSAPFAVAARTIFDPATGTLLVVASPGGSFTTAGIRTA